jgi:hypothetical protein
LSNNLRVVFIRFSRKQFPCRAEEETDSSAPALY